MKFLITSDVHEHEEVLEEIIFHTEPDAIIDCGDHNVKSIAELTNLVPRYIVYGNHEPQDIIQMAQKNKPFHRDNIHYLPSGVVTEIPTGKKPLRLGVIGGNYLPPEAQCSTTRPLGLRPSHIDLLKSSTREVDIMLTHDASTKLGLKIKRDETAETELLDSIIKTRKPKLWFSGHYHKYKETKEEDTTLIGLTYPYFAVGILQVSDDRLTYNTLFNRKDFYIGGNESKLNEQFQIAKSYVQNQQQHNFKR